jgi:copper(I)-binding protein
MLAICAAWLFSGVALAQTAQPEITIDGAWIRAMPPTQRTTAAYFAVTNSGPEALEITGATADMAESAEIHVSREIDGYTRMERVDTVPLAPGQTVHLTPGGMHLMLTGLEQMPAPGTAAKICLLFSTGQSSCVNAGVMKGQSDSAPGAHEHHH